jgi:glycosyltransferase involved in cell wall biosynthesis
VKTLTKSLPSDLSFRVEGRLHHCFMRIAFCITELNVGGAERCLTELATRLNRSRFDPSVFCLGPQPTADAALLNKRVESANVPIHFLGGRGAASAPRVFWQLRRQFRRLKPEVVQTFLWHANVLGVLAARAAGVPRIVTGLRVAEPRRRWRWSWERLAGRWADRHVAVSEGVAAFAREKIGLRSDKIIVIPNGVEVPRSVLPADLSHLGLSPGRRAIAFVGRLEEQKGIVWLIDQMPQVFAKLPMHDLVVVGGGPLESALRTQVERLGLGPRVHFVGWRKDVLAILAASDLVIAPSLWEGMSNVVLEAMAAARPIVAFGVEGMSDAIGDARSPQIVAEKDRASFIDRVAEIAADERLRTALGEQNRARVSERFRVDQMVARYGQLYEALWTATPRRPSDSRR